MSFYSPEYLEEKREDWINSIRSAEYLENGVWKEAIINSKTVDGENLIILANAASTGSSGTLTQTRLISVDGKLVGSQEVKISRSGIQSVLLKFVLPIREV